MPQGKFGVLLEVHDCSGWLDGVALTSVQVWMLLEARELPSAAVVNADNLVKYDWRVFLA